MEMALAVDQKSAPFFGANMAKRKQPVDGLNIQQRCPDGSCIDSGNGYGEDMNRYPKIREDKINRSYIAQL